MDQKRKRIWITSILVVLAIALFLVLFNRPGSEIALKKEPTIEGEETVLPKAAENQKQSTDQPTVQQTTIQNDKPDIPSTTEIDKEEAAPTKRPVTTRRITNPPTTAPPANTPNPWKETVVEPTCEEEGYILHENLLEGYTVIDEEKPPLGHAFGVWIQDTESGLYLSTCTRCGKQLSRRIPYGGTIPRIDLFGSMDGISKTDRVTLEFVFTSPTEEFSCYSYTTWQGHNTLQYSKKNYTIRLFEDEKVTDKHRLVFKGWQREHKYILKANYRDVSQVRNLIAANLWADMAACRPNLFETLKRTSNYGAVDGFPVVVYLNDEFHGLYTMNLHIDNDLYQMEDEHDAILIANSEEPEETRFVKNATFTDEKNAWEVEYCGTGEDNQWIKDKLNELITFVKTSDDQTFREHLGDYLDVDGAVDYLIFLYVTGLERNAAKDLVLLKYHDCEVLIPTVYDMERAFGLSRDGASFLNEGYFLPNRQDDTWNSNTGSILWDRLLELFEPEIQIRYAELRKLLLVEEKMDKQVDAAVKQVPSEFIEKDLSIYPRQVPQGDPGKQIKTYIHTRLQLLDGVFSK